MVKVKPFKGITYNAEKIENLEDVVSPPYDIINEEMQSDLYQKHPNNFVKLILNKIRDDDNEKNNRYTRSKHLFENWLEESILKYSDKSCIFPYKIEYELDGNRKKMNGFFTLLKLDHDYKLVKAHERTLSKPKADRLNLLRQCKANLEPILLLYIDEDDLIRKKIDETLGKPIIDIKGFDGFNHKLFKSDNKEVIGLIKEKLDNKILFIADGHHRYQTAINFSNEMSQKLNEENSEADYNYRMVILVNMFDQGLSILPTHRLIKKSNLDIESILKNLKKYFEIEERAIDDSDSDSKDISKEIMSSIKTNNEHTFALFLKNKYYILNLKDNHIMNQLAKNRSRVWRTLDVSILHKIVLEKIMGINQDNLEEHVKYTRVDEEAIKLVNQEKFDLSILMNATKIEQLKAVADAGEHMPQKSTYFLPKMLSGLVIYKMDIKKD